MAEDKDLTKELAEEIGGAIGRRAPDFVAKWGWPVIGPTLVTALSIAGVVQWLKSNPVLAIFYGSASTLVLMSLAQILATLRSARKTVPSRAPNEAPATQVAATKNDPKPRLLPPPPFDWTEPNRALSVRLRRGCYDTFNGKLKTEIVLEPRKDLPKGIRVVRWSASILLGGIKIGNAGDETSTTEVGTTEATVLPVRPMSAWPPADVHPGGLVGTPDFNDVKMSAEIVCWLEVPDDPKLRKLTNTTEGIDVEVAPLGF